MAKDCVTSRVGLGDGAAAEMVDSTRRRRTRRRKVEDLTSGCSGDTGDERETVAVVHTVHLPTDTLKELMKIFAAADNRRVESSCWWFCKHPGDRSAPQLALCVVAEHTARVGNVVDTANGHKQVATLMAARPDLSLFAYCLVWPSSRRLEVGAPELQRLWSLQTQSRGRDMLLAIACRAGKEPATALKLFALRQDTSKELGQRQGRLSVLEDPCDFLCEVDPTWLGTSSKLDVQRLGHWVAGDAAAALPAPARARPAIASAAGQAAQDVLELLRRRPRSNASVEQHIVADLVGEYIPPGGFIGVNQLYDTVRQALFELRSQKVINIKRPTRGAPVGEWRVWLVKWPMKSI